MQSHLPELLRPQLEEYLAGVRGRLPEMLDAFYVVGSIALGGFNPHFSDIDFVAVLKRRLTPLETGTLGEVHRQVERNDPRWKMSGGYYLPSDLGRTGEDVPPYPAYHDGRMLPATRHDLNLVTWWTLKNRGIALLGPEPQTLPFEVDWDLLVRQMHVNLNTYWAGWTTRPDAFLVMLSDWGVQWTVLGVLRQFYTFRERGIATKEQAGEYGLSCLPGRWHPLIAEALSIRQGKKQPAYRSRIRRMLDARQFLKQIIADCSRETTGLG